MLLSPLPIFNFNVCGGYFFAKMPHNIKLPIVVAKRKAKRAIVMKELILLQKKKMSGKHLKKIMTRLVIYIS